MLSRFLASHELQWCKVRRAQSLQEHELQKHTAETLPRSRRCTIGNYTVGKGTVGKGTIGKGTIGKGTIGKGTTFSRAASAPKPAALAAEADSAPKTKRPALCKRGPFRRTVWD
jgi:hypothetical protein